MSRISSSSSGGIVSIQDTAGNALNSSSGALDVNVVSSTSSSGFSNLSAGSPGRVAVGLTSVPLFAANANRKYAHIFNNSGFAIFIQYTANAVQNQGIRVPPNGLYTIETTNLWLGAVNAIGVETNQLIDILEGE